LRSRDFNGATVSCCREAIRDFPFDMMMRLELQRGCGSTPQESCSSFRRRMSTSRSRFNGAVASRRREVLLTERILQVIIGQLQRNCGVAAEEQLGRAPHNRSRRTSAFKRSCGFAPQKCHRS
jgi:hypothetical protein